MKAESVRLQLVHGKNKISSFLLFCLLLFLPTQLGFHFWPSWAYVSGQRIDYLSPTLFVTDILACLLFGVTFLEGKIVLSKKEVSFLVLLIGSLGISIVFSLSPFAGWYGMLKLLEVIFIAWYSMKQWHQVGSFLGVIFPISLTIESVLALWQFVLQQSVGGLWYFLGERTFSSSTPGIANASLDGSLILRPYATFPHPNVLAGFLLVGSVFLVVFLRQQSKHRQYLWIISLVLSSIALFVTLSRTVIFLWFVIGIILLSQTILAKNKKEKLSLAVSGSILFLILVVFLLPRFLTLTGESLTLREQLFSVGWKMSIAHPLLGVGVNNFFINEALLSPSLPLQPIHNIFLLVLSQTGSIGLLAFGYLLFRTLKHVVYMSFESQFRKNIRIFSLLALSIFLFVGLVDHYFFTLQQGQLLTALIFGLAWSEGKN